MSHLLVVGYGYSARRIGGRLLKRGWVVSGTRRAPAGTDELEAEGVRPIRFDGQAASPELRSALRSATHLLISVPPDDRGDPLLRHHRADVIGSADVPAGKERPGEEDSPGREGSRDGRGRPAGSSLTWMGYLSTTGVYGDHGGDVVDEETAVSPGSARGRRRVDAEHGWAEVAARAGVPLQRFRLSGIYGPGRSVFDRLRSGSARRLVHPDLVFNRIHVDDIAGAVVAGIDHGEPGVFNVSDDLPAPPAEVVEHAARLLGREPPPTVPLSEASLSEAARRFYEENKRVDNRRLKEVLGYRLRHPTYREGLAAVLEAEGPGG